MEAAQGQNPGKELNVRQTEALVRKLLEPADTPDPAPPSPQIEAHLRSLEARFRSTLSTKVSLERRSDGVVGWWSTFSAMTISTTSIGRSWATSRHESHVNLLPASSINSR
ncbi:MAG: hypothetical protein R2856_15870 [Caldilineaceae bacterium]